MQNQDKDLDYLCQKTPLFGKKGFTLVEMIMVMGIIAALATMVILGFSDFMNRTKVGRCVAEIRGIEKDLISYSVEKNTYPLDATWVTDIGRSGVKDPWGRDYVYSLTLSRTSGGQINTDYELFSLGFDGATSPSLLDPTSIDDIVRGGDGAFVGPATKYGT